MVFRLPNRAARRHIPGALMALALLGLPGCKPDSEPAYPHGPPPAGYPRTTSVESADRPAAPAPRARPPVAAVPPPLEPAAAPPAEEPASAEERAPAAAEPAPEVEPREPEPPPIPVGALPPPPSQEAPPLAEAVPEPPEPAPEPPEPAPEPPESDDAALPQLSAATLDAISRRATPEEEREAARLNRDGLRRHRRGDYEAAVPRYLEALEADPRAVYPRYNLACAYSLLGDADRAVRQLLVHRELGHLEKLADARMDPDFIPIHGDARYREITGYAEVTLHPAPGRGPDGLDELADVVRAAKYPVRIEAETPPGVVPGRVYHRPDAAGAAQAVAEALSLEHVVVASEGLGDTAVTVIEPL